jgi:hypothetical protein
MLMLPYFAVIAVTALGVLGILWLIVGRSSDE